MSEEQQQQQQQQRQQQMQQHQQQQQQQQQIKSPKDTNNTNANNGNATNQNPPTPPRKTNIHEMRNQDFVSRLMAATPPYLYSAPMGPNNFFFSDMLRSLVAARNQENVRNLQLQHTAALARRPRKRTWSQQRSYFKENETLLEKSQQQQHSAQLPHLNNPTEKPLELTTHKPYLQHLANKYRKLETVANKDGAATDVKHLLVSAKTNESARDQQDGNSNSGANTTIEGGSVDPTLQTTPPAASLPPQDLVLPPPPPVWYPPLYPPYGIDPLHFFIDLRVSGHIYDRKKENISPLASAENTTTNNEANNNNSPPASHPSITLPHKHRHGSAFTVPTPRCNDLKTITSLQHNNPPTAPATDAINLSSTASGVNASTLNKFENYAKYYDFGESKENQPNIAKCNANYMLQHLPRLYSQFAARDLFAQAHNESLNHHMNNDSNNNNNEALESDNKSDNDCEIESDDRHSVANSDDNDLDESSNRERDIDVEIIDSIKYRTDGNSSRCTSPDESSITQID